MADAPAVSKKGRKVRKRGKKQRKGKKHLSLKTASAYEVKDNTLVRKKSNCPRCGPGTLISQHKNRKYCGKCGYTEFAKKESEKPAK